MKSRINKLVFVYNAKNGVIHELLDFAHKIVSPSTYSCELCKLTHNYFTKRKEWKEFEERSSFTMDFFHIDDFEQEYRLSFDYPVVLSVDQKEVDLLLDKTHIAQIKDVSTLIQRIEGLINE